MIQKKPFLKALELSPLDFAYQGEANGQHRWQDKLSPRFSLRAPDPNPWGKPWMLVAMADRGSNQRQERLLRKVKFALFPVERSPEVELIEVRFSREIDAGPIVDTWATTARVWAVMLAPSPPDNQLIYSIKPADPVEQPIEYMDKLYELSQLW